jgi:hypothetical protein
MTVTEARDSFDRMLETAKREGVLLRDARATLRSSCLPKSMPD